MDGSKDDVRIQDDDAKQADSGQDVIEIGWQVLLIPLAILVVVGGYYAGRMLRGGEAVADAPVAVQGAQLELGGAPSIDDSASGGASVTLGQPEPPVVITIDPSQLGGGAAQQVPPSNHPLIGQTAPDFTMSVLDSGEPLALSDLRGTPVMINFWATWCPPCRYEMPWLQSVYQKYAGSFELLAVDAGEKVPPDQVEARVKQYVDRMGLSFPVLLGDNTYAVQQSFGVYGLPATFIVDGEGKVVAHHGGMYPSEEALEAQLLEHVDVSAAADG